MREGQELSQKLWRCTRVRKKRWKRQEQCRPVRQETNLASERGRKKKGAEGAFEKGQKETATTEATSEFLGRRHQANAIGQWQNEGDDLPQRIAASQCRRS